VFGQRLKIRIIIITGLLLVFLLGAGCAPDQSFDARVESIIEPYFFSIARWELRAIPEELNQWIFDRREKIDDEADTVIKYFSATERIRALNVAITVATSGDLEGDLVLLEDERNRLQELKRTLEITVEKIIEKDITDALTQQVIFNPIDNYINLRINFPPVNFRLQQPPNLLVISPRERIESIKETTIQQNISPEDIEDIESKIDELGVSALIVRLGGIASYPSIVTNNAGLRFTINTTIEEWLHQYLTFKPLGFLYLLDTTGLSRNYEIATMNETLAGMISQEIGSIVYEKYYPGHEISANQAQSSEPEFDFNREMREIRKTVDDYLAHDEIEQAEDFMEQKRQYLASMGYYIRKLNQAYFAFYGTYADRPTSISPIGRDLKTLRGQSASLKDFLNTVAAMNSHQDLIETINETQQKLSAQGS